VQSHQPLTEQEFRTMFTLLHRYVRTEMDQWELWKFDTDFRKIYIDVSMDPSGSEEAYIDVTHLIDHE
jgi:hypothetical protein